MLLIIVAAKALLCIDTTRSVLTSSALTFTEVFLSHFLCNFTSSIKEKRVICLLKFAHNSFSVFWGFFPTVFPCYRLNTKRQVSHDFSFAHLQQFIVIQFTVFWLVMLCFLCATVAHKVVGFSKL